VSLDRSYTRKIFLASLCTLLFFVGLFCWVLNQTTKNALNQFKFDHLERTSRILQKELEYDPPSEAVDLKELCLRLSKNSGYLISLIDLNGQLLAASSILRNTDFSSVKDVKQAIQYGMSKDTLRSDDTPNQELACSLKVEWSKTPSPVILRVVLVKSITRPYVEAYQQQVILLLLLLLAVTVVLMWFLSKWLARPIQKIQTLTRDLLENKASLNLDITQYHPLDNIISALNTIFRLHREKLVTIIQQRNNQEAILSGMKEGLIALDANGRVSEINHAAELLLDMKGLRKRGRLLGELLRSRELIERQDKLTKDGIEFETEIIVNKGTSLERIFQVSGYLTHESIESHHSLMVFTDITRLRRLENMRQEFVANVSHELKTPLTSIRGYAETLRSMPQFSDDLPQRFLSKVEQNADRLHNIIEDLLSLSRIEQNGLAKDDLEHLSITGIFDRLKREFSPETLSRIKFTVDTQKEKILAHGPLLHQAIYNLIDNALKYSGEKKDVQVSVSNDPSDGVCFIVSDNGQGIAKEHLPHLTERFYRADKARSRENGGSGLGLSIVKHIAESHGGSIEIDSVLGEGSQFKIHLPKLSLRKS